MKLPIIVLLMATAFALAACGDSSEESATTSGGSATTSGGNATTSGGTAASAEEEANAQVCAARADIAKQLDELRGLTAQNASVDGVTANLQAIRSDLAKIKSAQGDLSRERRQEVQAASKAFEAQVGATLKDVVAAGVVGDAESGLRDALGRLSSSYRETLARVDCS